MIQEITNRAVIRSSGFEEQNFSIASSSAIFKILRDSLYSNKIGGILREYGANSKDAHDLSNQKDRPIEITFPTVFEPNLKFRDFGYGLSHEQMFNVFCVYGESTKTTSNEVVGYFGIGAKIGFAYISCFTITSIHKGVKSIYNAYLDESDCGKLALLASEESSEEQGLEISISVNPNDFERFKDEAKKLFRFWKPYPIFHNWKDFKPQAVEYHLLRQNRWGFLKNHSTCIVSGPIAYHFDESQIPNLNDIQRKILQKGLAIFVGIGDVNLQASRESIAYTPKTIKFLQNKIGEIEQEIIDEVKLKLNSLKTEVDGRRFFRNVFTDLGELGVISDLVKKDIRIVINGLPITEDFFRIERDSGLHLLECAYRHNKSYKLTVKVTDTTIFHYLKTEKVDQKMVRLFYDTKFNKNGRIRNLMKHYFQLHNVPVNEEFYVFQIKDIAVLKQYCDKTGIDINLFKDINTEIIVPKKKYEPSERKPTGNCRVYDVEDQYDGDNVVEEIDEDCIKVVDLDYSEVPDCFHIYSHYGKYYYDAGMMKYVDVSMSSIHNFLKEYCDDYKSDPYIYIVPVKNAAKVTDKFKSVKNVITPLLEDFFKKKGDLKVKVNSLNKSHVINGLRNAINKGIFTIDDKLSEIFDLIDFKNESFQHTELADEFGVKKEILDLNKEKDHLAKLIDSYLEQYPMLDHIYSCYWDDKKLITNIVNYIALVNNQNQTKLEKTLEIEPVIA